MYKLDLLTNLTSAVRRYTALQMLPRSPLMTDILRPSSEASKNLERVTYTEDGPSETHLNMNQKQAVRTMLGAVDQHVSKPRIVLLMGPPGTGKSHVIVAAVMKMFQKNKNVKICLATPSNAAVDELMRRLTKLVRENHVDSFSVVRIGNSENMHSDVKNHFIDLKTMKARDEALHKKRVRALPPAAQQEDENLTKCITRKQLEMQHVRNDPDKIKKIELELKHLQTRRENIVKGILDIVLTQQEQYEIYIQELKSPNVVCGTLSSFGHPRIINAFCRNENRRNNNHFTCAIIDEATQATELDSLIPLQYNMTKLFLVGDPHQLPPTVLSQKAQSLSYGLSLFERLNNYYSDQIGSSPVLTLKVQYRMDKEICHFPNNSFYKGMLTTDPSVIETCYHYPLRPYVLFDVEDGQELLSQSGSLSNMVEAEYTVALCRFLINEESKISARDIGIICAYAKQKKLIVDMLRKFKLLQVEVNTVDGFQGREKNIVILSCVRARSSTGTIGFMADKRRMNVALTRAKYALYIVCNLQSFESNSDWGSLIKDAKGRRKGSISIVQKVTSFSDFQNIVLTRCVKSRFQPMYANHIQRQSDVLRAMNSDMM